MNIQELAKQATGGPAWNGMEWLLEELEAFAALVAAHEREACAKVCEAEADDGTEGEWDGCCLSLANKIRARGEA